MLKLKYLLKFFISTTGVLFLAFLIGCSSGEKTNNDNKKILRMSVGELQTIDQHLMTGSPDWKIVAALAENLLSINYLTMELEPAVAETWEVSPDALKYTFKLRENAKWSNGDPITAEDFVYSWKRMLSPALGNQYANDLYAIKNAEAFHTGKLNDFSEVGVTAISPFVLEFELHRLDPLFLKRLASPTSTPVHKATIEKFGAIDDPTNKWTRAGNHVGNGPFRLVQWELNQILKVEKNPYYWDSEAILLDGIDLYPSETEIHEERLYRAGQIDLSYQGRVPTEKVAQYMKDSPEEIVAVQNYGTYFYLFNNQKAPFDNANVRRAFAYAVDRKLLVENVLKSGQVPAYALSPIAENYSPPKFELDNPDKAREFLAKAGYPGGEGFPTVTLVYNTMDVHRKIAIALQQMWKTELNVNVELENMEWKVFLDYRQNHEHEIARAGSFSNFLDPADFLDSFTTGHGMNDAAFANEEFDALVHKAAVQLDAKKRFDYLYQAEKVMFEEMAILPLFYYVSNYLISPKVKGFEFNIAGQPNYKGVDIVANEK